MAAAEIDGALREVSKRGASRRPARGPATSARRATTAPAQVDRQPHARRARSSSASSRSIASAATSPAAAIPLPSSLLMTAIPARVAGVREMIAVCPRPEPTVLAAALEAGVDAAVPDRRRPRDRRAGVRHRDGAARRQDRRAWQRATSPRRKRWSPPTARSTSSPDRARLSSSSAAGRPAWIAADLIAQAEHDPDARAILITLEPARSRDACRAGGRRAAAGRRTGARRRSPRNGAIVVTRDAATKRSRSRTAGAGAPGRR